METPKNSAAAANTLLGLAFPSAYPLSNFLGDAILNPHRSLNAVNLRSKSRFPPVPNIDPGLMEGQCEVLLNPPEFCNFFTEQCPSSIKAKSAIDPSSIGTYTLVSDSASARIHLNFSESFDLRTIQQQHAVRSDWVKVKQIASHAQSGDAMELEEEEGKQDEPINDLPYPFGTSSPCDASNNVYPISVRLEVKPSIVDASKRIRGYRPFSFLGVRPSEYYRKVIRGQQIDPHFKCGLFGELNNGLTVVMLALSPEYAQIAREKATDAPNRDILLELPASEPVRSSKRNRTPHGIGVKILDVQKNEKNALLLRDYVTLVALQFWWLLNGRWLERDDNDGFLNAEESKPNYMVYLSHLTDFSLVKSKLDIEDTAIDLSYDDICSLATTNPHLLTFVLIMLRYVNALMDHYRTNYPTSVLGAVCQMLDFSAHQGGKETNVLKNHTQFLNCAKFKIHNGVDFQNHVERVKYDNVKFFAAHSQKVGFSFPMFKSGMIPHYWSHLVVNPDSPIAKSESAVLFGRLVRASIPKVKSENELDISVLDAAASSSISPFPVRSGMNMEDENDRLTAILEADSYGASIVTLEPFHHLCVLRRLMFCCNAQGVDVIQNVLLHPDVKLCVPQPTTMRPGSIDSDPVVFRLRDIYSDQVCSSQASPFIKMAESHNSVLKYPFLLPPVVNPADLRYSLTIDKAYHEVYQYVPAMGRNIAQVSRFSESDVLCISRLHFGALARAARSSLLQGIKNFHLFTSQNKLFSINDGFLKEYSSNWSKKMAYTYPYLYSLGFNEEWQKLYPKDGSNNVFLSTGARLRFDENELRLLQQCYSDPGRFARDGKKHKIPESLPCLYLLWTLIEKVQLENVDDVDTVAHFVFYASGGKEASLWSEELFTELYGQLQVAAMRRKNDNWKIFCAYWSIPSKGVSSCNPYLAQQRLLLNSIDEVYDRCHLPEIPRDDLKSFITECAMIDLSQLNVTAKAYSSRGIEKAFSVSLEEFSSTCRSMISTVLDDSSSSSQYRKIIPQEEVRPVPVNFDGVEESVNTRLLVQVANSGHPLFDRWKEFFHKSELQTPSANAVVLFLLWHSYTYLLTPLQQNLSVLYPDSSLVTTKSKMHKSSKAWIERMAPASDVRQINKLHRIISAALVDAPFHSELKRLDAENTELDSKTISLLSSWRLHLRLRDWYVANETAAVLYAWSMN